MTDDERAAELEKYIANMHTWAKRAFNLSADARRYSFQIETSAKHKYIGWVSSYCIDNAYNYIDGDGMRAVGIAIPDQTARGHGYATQALCTFIIYLLDCSENEIYTQTWSGNMRMIGLAKKLGFEECCRKVGICTVHGAQCDGLTFRLNKERFRTIYENVIGKIHE